MMEEVKDSVEWLEHNMEKTLEKGGKVESRKETLEK